MSHLARIAVSWTLVWAAVCRAGAVKISFVDAETGGPQAHVWVARQGVDGAPQAALATADAAGQLTIDVDPAVRTALLATAPGREPTPFGFWGAVPGKHVVKLQPATKLSGRVLDDAGHGVANQSVVAWWHELTVLMPFNYRARPPLLGYELKTTTDAAGRFVFEAADPRKSMPARVGVPGGPAFGPVWESPAAKQSLLDGTFALTPRSIDRPDRVTPPTTRPALPPATTIRLRVVDDKTGRPIAGKLRVAPGGQSSPDQNVRTDPLRELEFDRPELTWRFDDGAYAYFLRVRADGYADRPTRLVKGSETSAELELRLTPTELAQFTVRTPDGHPAAGARAYLATPTVPLNLDPDARPGTWRYQRPDAVAGADGVVDLPVPGEAYRLAIAHEGGWAEIDPAALSADAPVKLTPWASAVLHIPGRPQASAQPQSGYSEDKACWIDWNGYGEADAAGTIRLPHLKPDRASVYVFSGTAGVADWSGFDTDFLIKPGESIEKTFADGPHTVRASLLDSPGYRWQYANLEPHGRAVALPGGLDKLSAEDQDKAVDRAIKAAGKEKTKPNRVRLGLELQPDGRLGASGLFPGTYQITAYGEPLPGNPGPAMLVNQYVVVPDGGPAETDVGVIHARVDDSPTAVGKSAPPLKATTLDGKPFDLAALRGKWVLLDFWGTWCGFCVNEEPTLKDAYDGWAVDGRLTMVGLSVDDTPERVREHAATHALPWTQIVLGKRDETDVPTRFGVQGYPTTLLIAPDGTVAADGLRGGTVRQTLLDKLGPATKK